MAEPRFADLISGKEVHFRLVSNDLLEAGKPSVTAVAAAGAAETIVSRGKLESREFPQYPPETMRRKLLDGLAGKGIAYPLEPSTVVVVAEKGGSLSADDARYIEWLAGLKREYPMVLMLSETQVPVAQKKDARQSPVGGTFWDRQWRRFKALPAPVTKDAALAAIPRTAIPVGFSLFLAFLKINEIPLQRSLIYAGLAVGFAVGFALFNQTVLNYITFCSELTRDVFDPAIKALERRFAAGGVLARFAINALAFVSARGDVLIAGPSLGVGCTFIARLALGAVGETQSVMTPYGFFLVVVNVLVGSFAGGPYGQVIAHLRAVGRISNRASMYLGIIETIKMELGRLADFGMQTLYNSAQLFIAAFFWALLLVVDRCYRKAEIVRLAPDDEAARRVFAALRARAGAPLGGAPAAAGLPVPAS